jgi:hypothetical protein
LDAEALSQSWSLSFEEIGLMEALAPHARIGFAAQLKFYCQTGRFPDRAAEIPAEAAGYLAEQVDAVAADLDRYDWTGRSGRRHRHEIFKHLGIRYFDASARQELSAWLGREVCPSGVPFGEMIEQAQRWCRDRGVRSPVPHELERLVRSIRRDFETVLFARIAASLAPETIKLMEDSLAKPAEPTGFDGLKAHPGPIGLESVLIASKRIAFIRSLKIPDWVQSCAGAPLLAEFRRRIAHESGWDVRRHPTQRRLGLYAIFLAHRQQEITDGLVDLLVETVHKFSAKAERKIVRDLAKDFKKVQGKERLLARIAEASIARPDGAIRDVVFPVADKETLAAIIKEYKAEGSYHKRIHAVLRSSYANHYRRMLPSLLAVLDFRSNIPYTGPCWTRWHGSSRRWTMAAEPFSLKPRSPSTTSSRPSGAMWSWKKTPKAVGRSAGSTMRSAC